MKYIIITLFTITITFAHLSNASDKGDVFLSFNVGSYHVSRQYCVGDVCEDYNEGNYGAALSYTFTENIELQGGFFNNSFNNTSIYGFANIKRDFDFGFMEVSPGLAVGAASGYEGTIQDTYGDLYGGLLPVVLPNVTATFNDKYRVNVGYIPKSGDYTSHIVTLQLGIKF